MLVRVTAPDRHPFQLRRGEEGVSVFDTDGVAPELTTAEILAAFRPGSGYVELTREDVEAVGLEVVAVPGGTTLPERLQIAHREIRPPTDMSRSQFKALLRNLI
ncbi:MAG: hypothetical protein DWQ34_17155 [Planctomycetota bacterium]|nr:MAG: hypothetical protein DWQ34_17155 [Planctomycetota bacterium]REK24131.1 MAG: hypothetical protein DWQ41_13865 [Planctomycetota bacterium]REK38292.1 MAG: hypothetical protein DWQ45_04780 [Planctomycetota bacterium]